MKEGVREQLQAGWKDAAWAVYFSRALLPALALALLLSWAIEGRISEPPSVVAWVLCVPATLAALYWAGIKEGWNGRLGRPVWILTVLIVGYWLILLLVRQQQQKAERRLRLAGHAVSVTAELPDGVSPAAGLPRSSIHWEPVAG